MKISQNRTTIKMLFATASTHSATEQTERPLELELFQGRLSAVTATKINTQFSMASYNKDHQLAHITARMAGKLSNEQETQGLRFSSSCGAAIFTNCRKAGTMRLRGRQPWKWPKLIYQAPLNRKQIWWTSTQPLSQHGHSSLRTGRNQWQRRRDFTFSRS